MHTDPPPQITPSDPRLDAERAAADAANIAALQVQAEGDTASLMARYGTRLAMAGTATGSPLTSSPSSSPNVAAMANLATQGAPLAGVFALAGMGGR